MPAVSPHGAAPPFPHTFMAEWPNLKASPAESIFFSTSTFIIQPNHVSWLLMKVVMRGQNQDALSSTLWEPATPQNLQGLKTQLCTRSVRIWQKDIRQTSKTTRQKRYQQRIFTIRKPSFPTYTSSVFKDRERRKGGSSPEGQLTMKARQLV